MSDKFKRSTPQTILATITPELAKEMLATSPGNRTLRPQYVTLLAQAMKRGEWRVTSQGIGFDILGRLRDAHHRLNACIQAGVEFKSIVVMGMPVEAYEVTDTGLSRTVGDRMQLDSREANILRLAAVIALGTSSPTVAQIRPIADAGLARAANLLIDHCGGARKFYSSVPIKLCACVALLSAANEEQASYVLNQYRALINLDFDEMSECSKSLVKQEQRGLATSKNRGESLARGMKAFDIGKRNLTRISISQSDIDESYEHIKKTINALVAAVPL